MSWRQQVIAQIEEVDDAPVIRFDRAQNLTEAQQKQAQDNLSTGATVSLISGDNYSITVY
jgi:hypothetical protein